MCRLVSLLSSLLCVLIAQVPLLAAPAIQLQGLREAFRVDRFVAYTPSEYCPLPGKTTNATAESIRADLNVLKPYFDVLVTYACNASHGLDHIVPVASEFGMRVVLGIWDVRSVREIETAVSLTRQYSNTVIAVIVGNETQLRGERWENLEAAIKLVRAALPAIPISTSEPITSYGNDDLREIVDFHAPICMWIFQGGNRQDPKAAVAWLKERITSLRELPDGDKPILIKEHGVPSAPAPFTQELQKEYLKIWMKEMPNTADYTSSVFEAFDLHWKPETNPSELGATEAHWGAWDGQRRPKAILSVLPKANASNKGQK